MKAWPVAQVMVIMALLAAGPVWLRAGMGDELAAAHLEKMGGQKKIQALQALRVEGKTFIQDKAVEVVMWAQRPNRLRIESQMEGKKFVQVFDGEHPPWQTHTAVDNGAPKAMDESEARDFVRNADFDGPLIDYGAKGFTVDYAGEDQIEGRPAYKLLVMNRRDEILFVWLDKDSYLMVKRLEYRVTQGRRLGIETSYKDYRPVKGVPQPYRVETRANGRVLNMTMIDKMDANPRLPRGTFDLPAELAAAAKNGKSAESRTAAGPIARESTDGPTPPPAVVSSALGEKSSEGKMPEASADAKASGGAAPADNAPPRAEESGKPGFLKRLFGFGQKNEPAPEVKPPPPAAEEKKVESPAEPAKRDETKDTAKPTDAKKPAESPEETKAEPKPSG